MQTMKGKLGHLRFKVFNSKKYLYVYIAVHVRLNVKHQITLYIFYIERQ